MTFYEQELRKIVGERYPDATYVGRACYVRLSDMNRAKIQFVAGIVANQYNALQLTILNRGEGLLIFENVVLPFSNPIPNNTQLYKIMTTRLSEVVEL